MHAELMEEWMGSYINRSWMRIVRLAWNTMGKILPILFFSRIMTLNTRVKRVLSGFLTMIWPAQSPIMNSIGNLWSHIKRQLSAYKNTPNSIDKLWERVEKKWNMIKPEVCQNLIEGMPRRIRALYKAKGGYTKY
jgi:hypothetical protein